MLLSGNFYLYLQNGYSQNITRHPVYDFRTNWVFYATSRFNQIWLVRKIPLVTLTIRNPYQLPLH